MSLVQIRVTEPTNNENDNLCKYSISDAENIIISLSYSNIEETKKSEADAGNRVETIAQIPMSNFIIKNPDGIIQSINLILSESKVISIKQSGEQFDNDKKIDTATSIAKEINNYK